MIAIKVENVVKKYKNAVALNGVGLTVESGELYGLLGLNGAGKTTLVNLLCGNLPFDGGDAEIYGYSVKTDLEKIKTLVDVSPQESSVALNLSVKENLEFFAEIYEKPKENAYEIMRKFGLDEVCDKRAKTLSGGYMRRLSIAAALVSEPKILFLDEPTLGLDVIARRELWKIVASLKGKITVVLTTHYLEEAEALCDRVGILKRGKLIAEGTTEELKAMADAATFEDAFVKISEGENAL